MMPRNWKKFQHYNNRCPPWIKVHNDLLKNPDWFALKDSKSTWVLINIWLIASEDVDGKLPDSRTLAFRLQMSEDELNKHLSVLNQWLIENDSIMLASCKQSGVTETETERETDIYVSRFNDFWKEYPANRKVGRKPCETKWKRNNLDKIADKIINHVKEMSKTKSWKEGFNPSPLTYINQERWEDELQKVRNPWDGAK
jgi:hypothetical protein